METVMNILNLYIDGDEIEVNTSDLEEDVPILLFNVTDDGDVVDFNPVGDPTGAQFTLYMDNGDELTGNWLAQSDDTIELLSQLDDCM